MREIRTLRATWRGLETWNGRDISAGRRASPRPYRDYVACQRLLRLKGSVAPQTERADAGTAATVPYGPQAERAASGDRGAGEQPSRCDDCRIAGLVAEHA